MPTINPNEPQNGETVDADVLHDQFNALNDKIDAQQAQLGDQQALLANQQAQINALAGWGAGPKVFSGAVVIGTNNQPGPYLMSSVKYHDDFTTGALSVEVDPNFAMSTSSSPCPTTTARRRCSATTPAKRSCSRRPRVQRDRSQLPQRRLRRISRRRWKPTLPARRREAVLHRREIERNDLPVPTATASASCELTSLEWN